MAGLAGRARSRRPDLAAIVVAAVVGLVEAANASCGQEAEACQSGDGNYHVALPAAPSADLQPAVIFLHGYGGSGAGALKNTALVEGVTARGYAVIAPDALPRRDGPRSWTFFPGWEGRDEAAFLQQVADDAAERFGLDRQNMVLAGFSAGAFMVNYLACAEPDAFAAYAPVSGGFWRPQPQSCVGPVRLFHSHGWSDAVVPLEGRFLGGGRFQQGDIFAGLELWRQTNHCAEQAPDQRAVEGSVLRRSWACRAGEDIEFLLFPGGHRVPQGWTGWMLDWYEAEVKPDG